MDILLNIANTAQSLSSAELLFIEIASFTVLCSGLFTLLALVLLSTKNIK